MANYLSYLTHPDDPTVAYLINQDGDRVMSGWMHPETARELVRRSNEYDIMSQVVISACDFTRQLAQNDAQQANASLKLLCESIQRYGETITAAKLIDPTYERK